MLQHLEIYIGAQKTIATYMLVFGLLLFVLAILIHLAGTHTLLNGFKYGILAFGIFATIGGCSYKLTEEKLLKSQASLYQADPDEFKEVEKERMQKVVKSFPLIQIVFVVVIILALVLILFLKTTLVKGLLFSLVLFLFGNLVIEQVSKKSIDTYYEQLSTIN